MESNRDWDSQPPFIHTAYKSTALRGAHEAADADCAEPVRTDGSGLWP